MKSIAFLSLLTAFALCTSCSKKECYKCQKNDAVVSTYCESEMTASEFKSAEETCSKVSGEWIKVAL